MIPELKPSAAPPQPGEEVRDREDGRQGRRAFLAKCGRFAAVTPPAMTMLLAMSSIPREAHAVSGDSSGLDPIEQPGGGIRDLIDFLLP
jgi:hypothetical protein